MLGIRGTDHLLTATHLGTSTAHNVVAHAPCPVLTVRGRRAHGSQPDITSVDFLGENFQEEEAGL